MMVIPDTPPVSIGSQPSTPRTGFFSLPIELREEIYTYALTTISPATYVIYRHAEACNWSFRRLQTSTAPPALLLASKAFQVDVIDFLNRTRSGPTLRVSPAPRLSRLNQWDSVACLYDKADERECVFDLAPVLSSARKVRVQANLSEDLAEQGRLLALLRWMAAVVNGREAALGNLSVELTLAQWSLRPTEKDSVWQVLDEIRCQHLEVICLWRASYGDSWQKEKLGLSGVRKSDPNGEEDGKRCGEVDVESAQKDVIESCRRRHGKVQLAQWYLGKWPSLPKFW